MVKKMRSLRLSDRAWAQAEKIAEWAGLASNTNAIEILLEREVVKMAITNIQLSEYVINSLAFGEGEIRARYNNEFSESEKDNLAEAAKVGDSRVADVLGGTDWLFDVIPDLRTRSS